MSRFLESAPELTPRRLRRLARKAHRARLAGEGAFESLAASCGVMPRQLRLLADAWAAAGVSGIDALSPAAPPLAAPVVADLDTAIEEWRRRHYPLETLHWEVWRNRVTVRQVVPGADRLGPVDRLAVFQLRRTSDAAWHLYRTAVHGEWWPVVVTSQRASLGDCLDAVRLDVALQFWPAPRTVAPPPRHA